MITKSRLPGGMINGGVHQLGTGSTFTTGNVWYVSSVLGSASNTGKDPQFPLATIAQAQSSATASNGDVVIVMPGHAETLTAVLTLSKAGVTYIGLGSGTLKPTITINAAADAVSISGASVIFANFHFAAPETDEATAMVNIAASGVKVFDLSGIGSKTSKNFVDCITIASGSDVEINGVDIRNTTVAVNSFISIETAVARLTLKNIFCFGDTATGGLIDGATATQLYMENVNIGTVGTTQPAAVLDSNPTGFAKNCNFAGTSTTLANNAALGTGLRLFDVKVLEETDGSKQGALIPAVDTD